MSSEREAVRPIKAWVIVGKDGEIRLNQLRTTKEAARTTLLGWQYQGRRWRIVPVEICPLPHDKEAEG